MDLLHFSRDTNTIVSSKGDDGYGFLWDMDLEENSLEDAVASHLDATTFDVDNDNSPETKRFLHSTSQICLFNISTFRNSSLLCSEFFSLTFRILPGDIPGLLCLSKF
ncbi:unnamed protein product [Sphenostylis stenocarpa]|uniref:Uncharacterized protein n=1 Tax=Sphenostylis stenocarpa TaxID=92480 RepID=A0AA86S4M8_9FABA|nr:unnamed protein product [Sphenostylis stenocarpa]